MNIEYYEISDNNILLLKNKLEEYNIKLLGYGSLFSFEETYILSFNVNNYGFRKISFQEDHVTLVFFNFTTNSWHFEAIPINRPKSKIDYDNYISNVFSQTIEYMVLKDNPAKIILNYIK